MLRTKTAVAGVGISANVFSFGIGEKVFGILHGRCLAESIPLGRSVPQNVVCGTPFVAVAPRRQPSHVAHSCHKLLLNFRSCVRPIRHRCDRNGRRTAYRSQRRQHQHGRLIVELRIRVLAEAAQVCGATQAAPLQRRCRCRRLATLPYRRAGNTATFRRAARWPTSSASPRSRN